MLVGVSPIWLAGVALAADIRSTPTPVISLKGELKTPSSILAGSDGRLYVSDLGEPGKDGDGRIFVIVSGKPTLFAEGLDDPRGLASFQNRLYVADKKQIRRFERDGKGSVYVATEAFDKPPTGLTDLTVDEGGQLYASDESGVIFKIDRFGKGKAVTDATKTPSQEAGEPGDGRDVLSAGSGSRNRQPAAHQGS